MSGMRGPDRLCLHRPIRSAGLIVVVDNAAACTHGKRHMGIAAEWTPLLLFGTGGLTTTLDPTVAEMFAIAQGAASLPGQWSAISQCSSNGVTYAGLIAPGTERVSILIGRDIEGLYVARAGGEVMARGCASVTDALTAVRWSLRQV